MKYIVFISSFFLFIGLVNAQSQDISGTWQGTSTYLKEHTHLRYELEQNGEELKGFAYTKSANGKDSTKAVISGTVKETTISLRGEEYIYKVGLACLPVVELAYRRLGNQETLIGKWKGDMSLSTCAPILGGTISVFKEETIQQISGSEALVENTKERTDAVEMAMMNELNKRKYFALIIGINQYADESIPDLDNPITDASNLARVLIDNYSFKEENVKVLKDATLEDIISSLDELTVTVTDKDNLLVFYAGHGIWSEQLNQGYWLPSNASMKSKSYWLSNSTLRDYVGGINSKHTLLISDACFSGGILKERSVYGESRAVLEMYKLPSRKAITSGTLKTVPDKSVFIEYLLKNLDGNTSTLLSADQLFRSFKTAVINNSPNGQVPQYGPISQAGDEGGDFIFLRSN
jgi:hypothetical protein